jgi:hypothetical protein
VHTLQVYIFMLQYRHKETQYVIKLMKGVITMMNETLKNVVAFSGSACGTSDPAPSCGSACGAKDPAPACGSADPESK